VTQISYDESTVHVNLATDAVEHSPAHDLALSPETSALKQTIAEVLAP